MSKDLVEKGLPNQGSGCVISHTY